MGPTIRVAASDLTAAQTVCTMQATHLRAIGTFIATNCRIDKAGGGMGFVLMPFASIYAQGADNASDGFTNAEGTASGLADGLEITRQLFTDQETGAIQGVQDTAASLDLVCYAPPRSVADETPTVLSGGTPWVPSGVKGVSSWFSDRSGEASRLAKPAETAAKSMGWAAKPGTSAPERLSATIDDAWYRPKNLAKGGLTWIEDSWLQRAADKEGMTLTDYKAARPGRLDSRFYSGYDRALMQAGESGKVSEAAAKRLDVLATKENFQTVSRGMNAGTELVKLGTGTVDLIKQTDKTVQTVHRSDRVADVANGKGGYGDSSLSAMGIDVPPGIREIEDPSSAIATVPASQVEDIGESLRWKAGVLLGGLDWIISQIIDPGPIERLATPLTGDWHALDVTRQCWGQAGVAVTSVGHNFEGLPQMLSEWEGATKDAFAKAAGDIADTMYDFADGCYAMSDVTAALLDLAQAAMGVIADLFGVIGDWLTRLAVEAAIPVFGWIAGAIDVGAAVLKMTKLINMGLKTLKTILEVVDKVIKVIETINKIISVIKTLEKGYSALVNVSTALMADDATETAFAT